jgi:hypothetical protein
MSEPIWANITSSSFYNSEFDVIQRSVASAHNSPRQYSQLTLEEYYEIEKTAEFISKNNYKRVFLIFCFLFSFTALDTSLVIELPSVLTSSFFLSSKIALQFPDILLCDASTVASLLEKRTKQKIFVLADTSFGGRTSLSRTFKHFSLSSTDECFLCI